MSDLGHLQSIREELAFFGTVAASLCHEMKNVLATIDELSGLLSDLCAAGPTRAPSPQRLHAICGKISQQVVRGEELVGRMSRFSHSVDEAAKSVDLNRLVTETIELSRRFASLEQVTLDARVAQVPVTATLDPFGCRHAVFLGIRLAMSAAAEQRTVTVSVGSDDSHLDVLVASADPFESTSAPQAELRLLESVVARLGGRLGWVRDPGRDRLVLSLE